MIDARSRQGAGVRDLRPATHLGWDGQAIAIDRVARRASLWGTGGNRDLPIWLGKWRPINILGLPGFRNFHRNRLIPIFFPCRTQTYHRPRLYGLRPVQMMFGGLYSSSCGPWSKGPATSQSCYPYLSTNPFDGASAAVYNLGPLPWCLQLNLFSSDGKNPRNTILLFFSSDCLVSEWHHSYTRESDAAHSAAKGGRFLPPKNASSTIRAQQAA